MPIEFLTPEVVSINGYSVDLHDNQGLEALQSQNGDERLIKDVDIAMGLGTAAEAIVYQQIPIFINLARQAAHEQAVSYRDFKVGASAFAVSNNGLRSAVLCGANFTPHKGAPKNCAEMDILKKVRSRGLDRIVAMAVFGPPDFGTVNSVSTRTLHPCDECRELLKQEPAVHDDTLFIMGNPEGEIELFLKPDLIRLHAMENSFVNDNVDFV